MLSSLRLSFWKLKLVAESQRPKILRGQVYLGTPSFKPYTTPASTLASLIAAPNLLNASSAASRSMIEKATRNWLHFFAEA